MVHVTTSKWQARWMLFCNHRRCTQSYEPNSDCESSHFWYTRMPSARSPNHKFLFHITQFGRKSRPSHNSHAQFACVNCVCTADGEHGGARPQMHHVNTTGDTQAICLCVCVCECVWCVIRIAFNPTTTPTETDGLESLSLYSAHGRICLPCSHSRAARRKQHTYKARVKCSTSANRLVASLAAHHEEKGDMPSRSCSRHTWRRAKCQLWRWVRGACATTVDRHPPSRHAHSTHG